MPELFEKSHALFKSLQSSLVYFYVFISGIWKKNPSFSFELLQITRPPLCDLFDEKTQLISEKKVHRLFKNPPFLLYTGDPGKPSKAPESSSIRYSVAILI